MEQKTLDFIFQVMFIGMILLMLAAVVYFYISSEIQLKRESRRLEREYDENRKYINRKIDSL